jgi:disulfide bond formation protein DsbB
MTVERPSFTQLEKYLQQWENRRQTAAFLVWIPRGLLLGLLTAVLIAALARWQPVLTNFEVGIIALVLAVAGLVLGTAVVLFQRHSLDESAQFADRAFGLQERCHTAVELQQGRITTEPDLSRRQLQDTLRTAAQVNLAQQLPLQIIPREWLLLLAAIALLITAVVWPNPQATVLQEQRAVTTAIEEQIETLEQLEETIANNEALTPAEQEALLEPLQDAREQLQSGELSQEEALATLATAERELQELAASNDTTAVREQLQNAGATLASNETSQSVGEAMQTGDFAQASAATAALAEQVSTLSAEEQATLAEDLAETAAALSETDPELAQELASAAEALQEGDTATAQEALEAASETLSERSAQQAAAEQAQDAASQLGEGRQEVAQAGQTGEETANGQAQTGEASQNGENGQNGQQAQNGQGQTSEGQGSLQPLEGNSGQNGAGNTQTNPLTSEGQGQTASQGQTGQDGSNLGNSGGPGPGGGSVESIFVPETVDLSGEPGVDVELPAECIASPESCGGLLNQSPTDFGSENSQVPYTEVLGQYREEAYDALDDDYIPLGMKRYVRDYFSSLEPSTNE